MMRPRLGTLPPVCQPTPSQAQLSLRGPLRVGTAGEPQPALERAGKEGRPEQGKREMQCGKAEVSRTARHKFGLKTYCFEFPSTTTNTSHNSTESSHHAQHTCNRQAGKAAHCIHFPLHPSVLLGLTFEPFLLQGTQPNPCSTSARRLEPGQFKGQEHALGL